MACNTIKVVKHLQLSCETLTLPYHVLTGDSLFRSKYRGLLNTYLWKRPLSMTQTCVKVFHNQKYEFLGLLSRACSAQTAYQNILPDDGNCSICSFEISILVLGCRSKHVERRRGGSKMWPGQNIWVAGNVVGICICWIHLKSKQGGCHVLRMWTGRDACPKMENINLSRITQALMSWRYSKESCYRLVLR